jgi:hypothetical protein
MLAADKAKTPAIASAIQASASRKPLDAAERLTVSS